MVEQAIQMALQPPPSYNKMQRAFSMYEEGQVKGQKTQEMTGATLQKALEGKLAPKLTHFKIFQGLQVRITYIGLKAYQRIDCFAGRRERQTSR